MFKIVALALLVVLFLGMIHYIPEPVLTADEIYRHQLARDIIHGRVVPDPLLRTRGVQISVSSTPTVNSSRAAIEIDWPGLAAMMAVLGAIYGFITRLVVGPMMDTKLKDLVEGLDKRYVMNGIYQAEQQANENILHEHLRSDERFQESLQRQLDQIWRAVRKTGRDDAHV